MDRMEKRLVAETKTLIQEVEAGNTQHAAWIAVKDRVEMIADGRTHRQVGDLIGKPPRWVGKILAWDASAPTGPFSAEAEGREKTTVRETKRALATADEDEVESLVADLPLEQVTKIANATAKVQMQKHPATRTGPPMGLGPEPTFGFTMEMGKPTVRLKDAIDLFVATWEKVSPEASEDELQVVRDLVAPKLLTLRATVEGIPVE